MVMSLHGVSSSGTWAGAGTRRSWAGDSLAACCGAPGEEQSPVQIALQSPGHPATPLALS